MVFQTWKMKLLNFTTFQTSNDSYTLGKSLFALGLIFKTIKKSMFSMIQNSFSGSK